MNLDKYSCNFCKSKNLIIELDYDSRDYYELIVCKDCKNYLDIMDLERILLKEQIKDIPGFLCLLSGSMDLILHAKNNDSRYPKEWNDINVKLIDHSQEPNHNCRACEKESDDE